MKLKKLLSTIAILFIALISGCADDDFQETIGVCPIVTSTIPLNGALGVPFNQIISVSFNKEMNASSINQSTFTVTEAGSTAILGTIAYSGLTATFTPASPLKPNTTYTGRVKTGATDLVGNALQTDYVWTFTTGMILVPVVISTDPINNATNVALNKVITATFSVPMDPLTLNNTTFTVKQGTNTVAGTITYTDATVSFSPTLQLSANAIYTVTITNGAKNLAGTPLANNYVWNFTTGVIPTVTSTDPSNNATGVSLNKTVTATFSEPMDPSTINSTTFSLKQGTTTIAGVVSYSGTTLSFNPTNSLTAGTTYTATITNGAKSLAGIPLANDYVWNFSTGSTPVVVGVDLGTAGRFGILAGVGISNNAGFSEIRNMDVGISPGVRSSVTGFPPAIIIGGAIYASDDIAPPGVAAMLIQAKQHLTDAYLFAEGASSPAPALVSGDQGGKTLAPGIYKSTSTLLIQSGNLTLDAQGDPNAVWIFQVASDFTTVGGAGGSVILSGGAQAKNVFWQVGSSATIGDYTTFKGNVLALTSITMNSHATAEGRMLARNGAVVMTDTNIIIKP